jgi:DNA-binding IclR family transcriptional regulator
MPVNPSPAVVRACDVLELLGERPEARLRLAEIARRLGMARATCQTVLLALCERGFLVRHDPEISYTLGPACVRLGEAAALASPALAAAAVAIARLADTTGFAAAVIVRSGDDVQVAETADGLDPFGPVLVPAQSVPLVAPFGAVFVAWAGPGALAAWLAACDPPLTRTERTRYTRAVNAVRARGYSVSVPPERRQDLLDVIGAAQSASGTRAGGNREQAVRALAHTEYLPAALDPVRTHRVTQLSAPVFDHRGTVALSLLMVGPTYELAAAEIDGLGALLLDAANRVTTDLGGTPLATRKSA